MPIIKSAKKRVKQTQKRTIRNFVQRRRLHDVQKEFYALIKDKDAKGAEKMLPAVFKVIDTCTKKNIIHKNRAARLKSKANRNLVSLNS